MLREKTADFIEELKRIHWFAHSGTPNEKYYMVFSLYEACDSWGKRYIEVWEPNIYALEDIAVEVLGDDALDEAFDAVSAAIGDVVWDKMGAFIERRRLGDQMGVCHELFDMVKRDLAWACVERILDQPGFFTMLFGIYKEGYFPCSWNGAYPAGRAVVL